MTNWNQLPKKGLPKNTRELRDIMERNGLNCKQVSLYLEVHLTTVKNWHRGEPAPPIRELNNLKRILKLA
jgi:DNA-binding transcriptional regulator YiaG